MDNMPYSLQTLPPEAIDILRYYADNGIDSAHTDAIMDGAELSDRGFGKGIRRLVTKNYVTLSGDQVYRLSDAGKRVTEELKAVGGDAARTTTRREAHFVKRHLVLVTPKTLVANQPAQVILGFDEAEEDDYLNAPASLLFRLAVTNGEPHLPRAAAVTLANRHAHQAFEITAGNYTMTRVRVEVCQYQDDGDEFDFRGGMYVDLPVSADMGDATLTAYGVDVTLKEESF
jgi:hypothetical protein